MYQFFQYRINACNVIHLLKNKLKYDTSVLREAIILRLVEDANKAIEKEQLPDLSKEELLNIMSKGPRGKGRKAMIIFSKWSKKTLALNVTKVERKDDAKSDDRKKRDHRRPITGRQELKG